MATFIYRLIIIGKDTLLMHEVHNIMVYEHIYK